MKSHTQTPSSFSYMRTTLLFLIGLFAVYIISLLAASRLPASASSVINLKNTTGGFGHSLVRFNEAAEVTDVDVLFVGSSHAYRGFDTRVLKDKGVNAFNLGSSNQTPINSYHLLKKYIETMQPKTIVMEVYWGTLQNKDGIESTIDISSNAPVDANIFKMMIASGTIQGINSTTANWALQQLDDNRLDDSNQIDISVDEYIPGGYVETMRSHNKELTFPRKHVGSSDKQLDYLERMIILAQENNAEMVFVRTPVSQELVDSIANFNEMTSVVGDLAYQYGVPFLDYNTPNKLTKLDLDLDTHFYDKHHLTIEGVSIFNEELATDLLKLQ